MDGPLLVSPMSKYNHFLIISKIYFLREIKQKSININENTEIARMWMTDAVSS